MRVWQNHKWQKVLTAAPLWIIGLIYAGVSTVGVLFGGAWAVFGLGGAILLALAVGAKSGTVPRPTREALAFALLSIGFAVLSCLHAVDPALAAYSTLKFATALIPLILLSDHRIACEAEAALSHAWRLAPLIAVSVGVLCFLLFLAIRCYGIDASQVTKLNRGFSYLLVFIWPLAACLILQVGKNPRFQPALFGFFAFLTAILFLTHSRAAQLGAVMAGLAFVAALISPRLVVWGLGLATLGLLGWPFYAQYYFASHHDFMAILPDSWYHRVEIWDYMAHRIAERPWEGWGMGNAHKLDWTIPHGAMYKNVDGAASHPHNAIVQLWAELGIGGLLVFVAMSFWSLRGAMRLPPVLRPYALACIVFIACLLLTAYNLWTDSLWAAMALTAFAFAVLGRSKLSQC